MVANLFKKLSGQGRYPILYLFFGTNFLGDLAQV